MHKKTIFILFYLLVQSFVQGQSIGNDLSTQKNSFDRLGEEEVFIHYNAPLLLTGEYLYYSVYVLNKNNDELSNISKIAYVELLGENGEKIFKHKINLDSGLGKGDFFIPVAIPSGNYKFIGYTQWMTNWGEKSFFSGNITILNPYTNNQRVFRSELKRDSLEINDNNDNILQKKTLGNSLSGLANRAFELSLDKRKISNREKVLLSLKANNIDALNGNYSISIRKRSGLTPLQNTSSVNFKKASEKNLFENLKNRKINLPELRGDLISGRVVSNNEDISVHNQKISFSIPGREYGLKILTTNESGAFSFSLDKEYIGDKAVFQILSDDQKNIEIELDEDFFVDYTQFKFDKFRLSSEMEKLIVERSIHNQIENAYFKIKPDTLKILKERLPFYGHHEIIYKLDDFTRFKTVKETFIEVVNNVSLTKDKKDIPFFSVRTSYSNNAQSVYRALVIVDGIILQNVEPLLNFDSRQIKTVKIVRSNYVVGSQIFQGIVDIETFDNDFYTFLNLPYAKEINLFKPLPTKNYFKQEYTNVNNLKKIPDYRRQLLWIPTVSFNNKEKNIDFFSSDVVGEFEISIEGFTKTGKPVSLRDIIRVE